MCFLAYEGVMPGYGLMQQPYRPEPQRINRVGVGVRVGVGELGYGMNFPAVPRVTPPSPSPPPPPDVFCCPTGHRYAPYLHSSVCSATTWEYYDRDPDWRRRPHRVGAQAVPPQDAAVRTVQGHEEEAVLREAQRREEAEGRR